MSPTIAGISLKLFYRRLGIFFAGNLLWLLTSLPLVTLPIATGALFYLVQRVIAEERDLDPRGATVSDFWEGWRIHWRRSLIVGLLDTVAMVVTLGTLLFYWRSDNDILLWLFGPTALIFLILLAMQIYLYPLLINRPELSPLQVAREAFIEVLRAPFDSIMLLSWLFILTVICTALGGPIFLVLFSLAAVLQSMALRVFRIMRGEIPPAKSEISEPL